MKILLVIPEYYKRRERFYQMPLGLAYINAALREADLDVECLNMNHIEMDDRYSVLADKVMNEEINYVLCGGISPYWRTLKRVFDTVKTARPSVVTICGGGGGYIRAFDCCRVNWSGLCSGW